jgi:eukaryotic-like serine/threonine-protein kinase
MAAHHRALAVREERARAAPANVLVQNDIARSHRNIGNIYRGNGRPEEALAEWEQACSIARDALTRPLPPGDGRVDLTGRSDPSAIIREDLASILLDRAGALREAGRLADAEADLQQSRDLFDLLVREQPDNMSLRSRLSDAYDEGASLLMDAGRLDESLPLLRRSLEIAEGLAAANPTVGFYRSTVAGRQLKLGWVLNSRGRTPEALNSLARGIELAEVLVAEEPGSAGLRNLLAQCLTQNGNLLLALGRTTEALPSLRRALEIQDAIVRAQPDVVSHLGALTYGLRGLGRAEAAAGRAAEARAAFERACKVDLALADKYLNSRYNLACNLALLVPVAPLDHRDALARRALDALQLARTAGYANLANVQIDHDLDSLRGRPDFRDFLLGMAFPANAFAGAIQ